MNPVLNLSFNILKTATESVRYRAMGEGGEFPMPRRKMRL